MWRPGTAFWEEGREGRSGEAGRGMLGGCSRMVTEEAGARPEPPGAALRGVASRGSQPEEAGGP